MSEPLEAIELDESMLLQLAESILMSTGLDVLLPSNTVTDAPSVKSVRFMMLSQIESIPGSLALLVTLMKPAVTFVTVIYIDDAPVVMGTVQRDLQ